MGAITPIAGGLMSLASTLNTVNQVANIAQNFSSNSSARREQEVALRQLQERQRLQAVQLSQDNALERERIATQAGIDAQERRDALKRAVARQRAQFGSSGVSQGGGGSSQAVLLGLFDETDDDLRNREALDNLRNRALDIDTSQKNSVNILQREQLRQSQRINNASQTLNRASSGIDFVTGALGLASEANQSLF